mgnify:CR=1 FL=1
MTLAEYQYEEYKADIDLIGMMTKPVEEEDKEQDQEQEE